MEYQFHRAIIFSRLLESYPYSAKLILSEAVVDICPLLRGEIWAAILGVRVSKGGMKRRNITVLLAGII